MDEIIQEIIYIKKFEWIIYAVVGGDTPASHSGHFEFRVLALFADQRLNAQLFLANQYTGHFIWFRIIDNGIGEFNATIQRKTAGDFQVLQIKSEWISIGGLTQAIYNLPLSYSLLLATR